MVDPKELSDNPNESGPEQRNWLAIRIVHLHGGCRAINDLEPRVVFQPNAIDGKRGDFFLTTYSSIYANLLKLGANIVGVDFYSNKFEVEGSVPPNWRPYHRPPRAGWIWAETVQLWRNIAFAAFKDQNAKLWDISARVAYQLRACGWRLRDLSELYSRQLNARIMGKLFKAGEMFKDQFTDLLYLALQGCLVDACILRDFLAEFIFEYVFASESTSRVFRVVTMSGLKKYVLNVQTGSNSFTDELKQATGEGGWITILGSYRDLVVHSVPLALAEHKVFIVCNTVTINGQNKLPIIICPIPANPTEITRKRSKQVEDFSVLFESFVRAGKDGPPKIDGLQYAHEVIGKLAELASECIKYSPIPPNPIVLERTDILGPPEIIDG